MFYGQSCQQYEDKNKKIANTFSLERCVLYLKSKLQTTISGIHRLGELVHLNYSDFSDDNILIVRIIELGGCATMYEAHVTLILIGMITAGAGRIVAVKIYYQMQEEEGRSVTPLFVTLLYLTGQALSLLVHFVDTGLRCADCNDTIIQNRDTHYNTIEISAKIVDENFHDHVSSSPVEKKIEDEDLEIADDRSTTISILDTSQHSSGDNDNDNDNDSSRSNISKTAITMEKEKTNTFICRNGGHIDGKELMRSSQARPLKRRGSKTGLTSQSEDAVAWVYRIPWFFRPAIPGFFNLCNSALRWACLVYVAASTAEMLISGLELVLSSFAARIIRKRIISTRRWFGIFLVTVGIITVGFVKILLKQENKEEERFLIGNILIVGQCIFSVLQDLSEEIFMQETDFPATLLLGMEGLFGLIFGIPLYILFASEQILSTRFNIEYEIFLVLLVTVTGILNIRTTEVTSSMTRNLWKQFRIILVWALGLFVYYIGSGDRFGEQWIFPGSLFVLFGFNVVLIGVYFYYSG